MTDVESLLELTDQLKHLLVNAETDCDGWQKAVADIIKQIAEFNEVDS